MIVQKRPEASNNEQEEVDEKNEEDTLERGRSTKTM